MIPRPEPTFVDRMVREGKWRPEVIPAKVVGLTRDVTVYRTERKTNLITHDRHGDEQTHCPPPNDPRRSVEPRPAG